MGSKRVGLARTQSLIENLKRELTDITGIEGPKVTTQFYGDGFISGSTTAPTSKTVTINDEIITTLTFDLTNLSASGEDGKIICNKEAAADLVSPAHIMQYNTTEHGILYKIEMSCIEAPAGNGAFADFNLETDDAALEMGADPGTNNVLILDACGNTAKGTTKMSSAVGSPTSGQYIYLVNGAAGGATDNSQYSAGKLIVRLYGFADF